MFKDKEEKSNVTMFRGYKGLKTVFNDILREAKGKDNLVIDSHGQFLEKMPYYSPHFIKGLETNKIKVKHLVRKGKTLNPSKTTEVRYFPKELDDTIITTNIYSDKVALILWTDVPEAVIIQIESAATAYRGYFELLWKTAKK